MQLDVDTFIAIAQGVASLGLAGAGLFVTTRPVHAEPRKRLIAEGTFIVLGIALLSLISWQAVRNHHERDAAAEHQRQSDARIGQLKSQLDQIGNGVGAINTSVSVLGKSPLPVTVVPDPHGSPATTTAATSLQPHSEQRKRQPGVMSIGEHVTGSIITQNQSGGSNTVNLGPPKRHLSEAARMAMVQILKPSAGTCVAFASTQGDIEASEFKTLLMHVFGDAGWAVEDHSTFMFFGEEKGFVITLAPDISDGAPQVRAIVAALTKTDNPIHGNRGSMAEPCGIWVQVWHAP